MFSSQHVPVTLGGPGSRGNSLGGSGSRGNSLGGPGSRGSSLDGPGSRENSLHGPRGSESLAMGEPQPHTELILGRAYSSLKIVASLTNFVIWMKSLKYLQVG